MYQEYVSGKSQLPAGSNTVVAEGQLTTSATNILNLPSGRYTLYGSSDVVLNSNDASISATTGVPGEGLVDNTSDVELVPGNSHNWTTSGALPASQWWMTSAYGKGQFILMGYTGGGIAGTTAASSTNGVTWSVRTVPLRGYRNMSFGNGVFIGVGTTSSFASYSTDGITWTEVNFGTVAPTWFDGTFANGKHIHLANSSTSVAQTTNGITWSFGTLPSAANWSCIAGGNGVFVVAASGATTAASSTDGLTWTTRTMPVSTTWAGMAFGNNRFVAIAGGAGNSTSAAFSSDGISWTISTLPVSAAWRRITFGNGLFYASCLNTTNITHSTDGITWTLRTTTSATWGTIVAGNGSFVIAAGWQANSNVAIYSPATTPTSPLLYNIYKLDSPNIY